ncbi:O-antigen ligase family protein [Clostridium tyrobutyricum]|uniref:O-antigen ligase family protein n=1 Tax=Clostridium tyrobutyricum TaxID=1519 RepID=UPI0002EF3443|nr:O-antigen ligase family protein [Clostridium tyrobutyricum]MEA5007112.1 O-antigen ligase family protein [Clostridium tyrobutyricum]
MTAEKLYKDVLKIFIFVLVFSGFITNYLFYTSSINTSTIIIDVLYLILFLLYILFNIKFKNHTIRKQEVFIVILYVFIFIFGLVKIFIDNNALLERISGFRNYFIYISIFILVSNLRKTKNYIELINTIINFSYIIFIFSILQFVLKDYLPDRLMRLKGEGIYTYQTVDILRANGLLGHPVIFGGFCVMIFILSANLYIQYKNKKYFVLSLIAILATFASSSRLSIIGILISILLIMILNNTDWIKIFFKIFCISFIFMIVLYIIYRLYPNLYIFNIFLAKDEYVQGSNMVHLQQVYSAIEYIKKNVLFGIGLGSQGISAKHVAIISDGTWFQNLLELGLPLFIMYIFLYIVCIKYVIVLIKKIDNKFVKSLGRTFIIISIYFMYSNFVNSSFLARICYILYWSLFGILIGYEKSIHKNIFTKF